MKINFQYKIAIIVVFLATQISFAHKDKIIVENCGIVKIVMKEAFDYAESSKIKVLARLSNEIAKVLNEKDTINIWYDYKFREYYNNEYLLQFNKDTFGNSYFKIRISHENIDIESVLKLVEYSIKNKYDLEKHIVVRKLYSEHNPQLTDNGEIKLTNDSFIYYLFLQDSSDLIARLVKSDIIIFKDDDFNLHWINGEYYFYNKKDFNQPFIKLSDKLLYSFQRVDKGLVIFIDKLGFYFIDNIGKLSVKHNLECGRNNVFYFYQFKDGKYKVRSYYSDLYYYLLEEDELLKEVK